MTKIVITREVAEDLGIKCSEIEQVLENGNVLINASPMLMLHITVNNITYQEDLIDVVSKL